MDAGGPTRKGFYSSLPLHDLSPFPLLSPPPSIIKKIGYNPKTVAFVPISGFHDDNMLAPTTTKSRMLHDSTA